MTSYSRVRDQASTVRRKEKANSVCPAFPASRLPVRASLSAIRRNPHIEEADQKALHRRALRSKRVRFHEIGSSSCDYPHTSQADLSSTLFQILTNEPGKIARRIHA